MKAKSAEILGRGEAAFGNGFNIFYRDRGGLQLQDFPGPAS